MTGRPPRPSGGLPEPTPTSPFRETALRLLARRETQRALRAFGESFLDQLLELELSRGARSPASAPFAREILAAAAVDLRRLEEALAELASDPDVFALPRSERALCRLAGRLGAELGRVRAGLERRLRRGSSCERS